MNKTIAIIGGDYRIIILSQMLKKDGFNIKTYGLEKSNHIQENEKFDNIEECVSGSEIIVSGIPFSKDGKLVYMPFSDKKLEIEEFFLKINGKTLIAGNINKDILNNVGVGVLDDPQKNYIYDLMQNEPLTIANAISTAEGAIQIAMEETKTTIHNSNILILGFGRIGKVLAKDLQGLGAKVTCEARKDSDLTWIEAYGYKSLDIKELDKYIDKFDIIFNTIPYMILDKDANIIQNATKIPNVLLSIEEQYAYKDGKIYWTMTGQENQKIIVNVLDVKHPIKGLIGDVNGDGKVNGKDWIRLYEHISETNELTGEELKRADVNGDGKVNGKDWIRLYEHINETNTLF